MHRYFDISAILQMKLKRILLQPKSLKNISVIFQKHFLWIEVDVLTLLQSCRDFSETLRNVTATISMFQ